MALTLTPITGMPEVQQGDDLAALIGRALGELGLGLEDGDVLVVSSKVVSKALGLWAAGERVAAVADQTRRVVAERQTGEHVTRVVVSAAGPVMAAAGVDASNTGSRDGVLLLPAEPDAEASRLRAALASAGGVSRLGVVLSDTAGRPWRVGQTDFALGVSGMHVLDDLRGGLDADGRPLAVTARAIADELAAAADLVKGKADATPVALVRGAGAWVVPADELSPSAASLLRTGPGDWFAYGSSEAVRASLGVEPGSPAAADAGLPSTAPEPAAERLRRAVRVALHGLDGVGADAGASDVRLSADSHYLLGVATARLQAALWGERLVGGAPPDVTGFEVVVTVRER